MTEYSAKNGVEHADSMTVAPDEFAYMIDSLVKEKIETVKEASEEDISETCKSVVADLKSTSPKRTGKYARGWKFDMKHLGDGSPYGVIYNSRKPGLTHLLEHGHGGKHPAKAKPHIEAAYERGATELNGRLKS